MNNYITFFLTLATASLFAQGSITQLGLDIDGSTAGNNSGNSISLSADGSHVAIVEDQNVMVYEWSPNGWLQIGDSIYGGPTSVTCVSISGDGNLIVFGSPYYYDQGNTDQGQAKVFEWNGNNWSQLGYDMKGEWREKFGSSVSLSADGNRLAIGATEKHGYQLWKGYTNVYEWDSFSWIGGTIGHINGEAAGDNSGQSVSLSYDGTRLAIGATGNDDNGSNAGHVRVFEWNGSTYVQLGVDIDGEAAGDGTGGSVSLSPDGSRLAIGSINNDGNGTNAGHVRVFEWGDSTAAWIQLGVDIDGEASYDYLGGSVSLSSDGNRLAVGAVGDDANGSNSGSTRVYEWNGFKWIQLFSIPGEATGDASGSSVSLSADGSRLAIGAPYNNGNGSNSGHVRVFSLPSAVVYNPDSAYINIQGCIVCDQYAVGDMFLLDTGSSWYTVVDRSLLEQKRDNGEDLSKVCVSLVTDMSDIFKNQTNFNDSISSWDVSNVTNMASMFEGASSFNQDISNWDTDSVLDLRRTFKNATSFNQDIDSWDISRVNILLETFYGASSFNQPLNSWDVSRVTNMYAMFEDASAFDRPLNNWNVAHVNTMSRMFYRASAFDRDLDNWQVDSVTDFSRMFFEANVFNRDISTWNVISGTGFNFMFNKAFAFNQDISAWNTPYATNMNGMFNRASSFSQDLSNWCVPNILTTPIDFDNQSALTASQLPIWGACVCSFTVDLGVDTVTCGNQFLLDAGSGFDSYLWNNGETTQNIAISASGLYYINATLNGCTVHDSVHVNLLNPSLTSDRMCISLTDSVTITVASPNLNYNWSTGANTQSIKVSPSQTTTYYCTTSNGTISCTDSIGINVVATNSIDSIIAINARKGVYQAFYSPVNAIHRLEYKSLNETVWQYKDLSGAAATLGYQRFNIIPRYNSKVEVRLSSFINGVWEEGCSYNFDVPCKDMSIQTIEQQQAFCAGDSALVRVGIAGGYGAKSILWSNGATTKRTYAQQGETLTVSVTDAAGCLLQDTITASTINASTAPTNLQVSRNGATFTCTWTPSVLDTSHTLIGYRIQYRLRNTQLWLNNPSVRLSTTQTMDWTGLGNPAGNYEFVVFARYWENGVKVNSNRSCIALRGYNGIGAKSETQLDNLITNNGEISIYPNPTEGLLYVQAPEGSRLRLLDVQGKTIIQLTTEDLETMIDLSAYAKGMYMLQVKSEVGIATKRVVKK